jgi:hypothetical protein
MIIQLQQENAELKQQLQNTYLTKSEFHTKFPLYYNFMNNIIFTDSTIVQQNESKMICNWINPNSLFESTLLYRASRDGDSSQKFHENCDNKGSTICFFKLGNGYRLGGFTNVSWNVSGGCKKDFNAFVFSLSNKEKFCLKNSSNGNAVFHCNNLGPIFWNGNNVGDIVVKQDCLKREFGIQIFNESYESSVLKMTGVKSETFKLMKLEDYEVFAIKVRN